MVESAWRRFQPGIRRLGCVRDFIRSRSLDGRGSSRAWDHAGDSGKGEPHCQCEDNRLNIARFLCSCPHHAINGGRPGFQPLPHHPRMGRVRDGHMGNDTCRLSVHSPVGAEKRAAGGLERAAISSGSSPPYDSLGGDLYARHDPGGRRARRKLGENAVGNYPGCDHDFRLRIQPDLSRALPK